MKDAAMKLAMITALAASTVAFAAPAQADPACVTPTGAPCAPMPTGCVQDNGLPCVPQPFDLTQWMNNVRVACQRNPHICAALDGM